MKKSLSLLVCVIVLAGCNTNSDSFTSLFKSFDRQGMLSNIGNNMVIPAYADVLVKVQAFNTSASIFKANPTGANLTTLQQSWIQLNSSWRTCEVYGFGPLDYLLSKPKIDNYHCDTAHIETSISTQSIIDETFINSQPVADRGLVAAEYLLFGSGGQDPLTLLSADTQRVNYLVAVGEDLALKLAQVNNEWVASGSNYIQTFISNDGNNVSSSLGKFINYIVMVLDEIKNMKLGKPMGKMDATVIPNEVESYYSKQSLHNIQTNIQALEKLFDGSGNSGLYSLLDHLEAKDNNGVLLSDKLKAQYLLVYADINAIATPLDQAVVSDLSHCETLYQDIYTLYIFVKVDVMNQLGLLLTFTDNDGD